MAILVDTNVLICRRQPDHPDHAESVKALLPDSVRRHDLCLCGQSAYEYWVVATRPAGPGSMALPPAKARLDIEFLVSLLRVLPDPPDLLTRWLDLVSTHPVVGKPAHDARLVALMLAHGVREILTFNARDFQRFLGLAVVTPGELNAR